MYGNSDPTQMHCKQIRKKKQCFVISFILNICNISAIKWSKHTKMLLWTGGHNIHNIVCLKGRPCFVMFSFGFKLYIFHYDVASLWGCCLDLSLSFLTFLISVTLPGKGESNTCQKLFPKQPRTITKSCEWGHVLHTFYPNFRKPER